MRSEDAGRIHGRYATLLHVFLCSLLMLGCTEPMYGTAALDAGKSPITADGKRDARAPDLVSADPSGPDASVSHAEDADSDEPPIPADAGTFAAPDAGSMATPPVGAAALLQGRYAMRRRFFGRSSLGSTLGTFVEEVIALVDITLHETIGKLKMSYRQCNAWTNVTSGVYSNIVNRPLFPELPPRVLDVILVGDTFHTEGPPHLIGYSLAPPSCTAGAKLPAPDKPWIPSKTCSCPGSSAPPTQEDDCRVTDDDGDKLPGITTRSSGGGLSGSEQRLRIRETSQYIQGVIAADKRHSAFYEVMRDEHTYKCVGGCMTWGVVGCPADRNHVIFEPLADDENFDCAALVEEVDAFRRLVSPKPINPTDC